MTIENLVPVEPRNRHERRAAGKFNRGPDRIMRLPEVCKTLGLSKASIYRLEKSGDLAGRLKLGNGTWAPVGWRSGEVYDYLDQRIAARDGEG